jgi:hypothetical protein
MIKNKILCVSLSMFLLYTNCSVANAVEPTQIPKSNSSISFPAESTNPKSANAEEVNKLKKSIKDFQEQVNANTRNNGFAKAIFIVLVALLFILILISGTSPACRFKESKEGESDKRNRYTYPLGVSITAWFSIASIILFTIDKVFNIVDFQPISTSQIEVLADELDKIKNADDLKSIKVEFNKIRENASKKYGGLF